MIWKFCASKHNSDWTSYSSKMKVVLHPKSIDFMEFAQLLSLDSVSVFFYHLFSHHRLQRILWHSTKWLKGCTPLTYLLCEFFVQRLPFLWTLAMILVWTTLLEPSKKGYILLGYFFSLPSCSVSLCLRHCYHTSVWRRYGTCTFETLYTKCNLWSNIKMSIEQVCE